MSDSPEIDISQEAELNRLQKEMAGYLAQKLTFSLFEPSRYEELKDRIRDLVNEKLLADGVPLEEPIKNQLVEKIISGMPVKGGEGIQSLKPAPTPPEDITFSLNDLQAIIKPYLASRLSDDLFQPDRKTDLAAAIKQLIRGKISEDELPVPPSQEKELICALYQTMGLPPDPSLMEESAPAETDEIESVPTRKIPSVSDQTAPDPKPEPAPPQPARKPIPKPGGSMLPLKALTHEIKRDLLYHLSANIQPETLASGDELQVRAEIFNLIHGYCEAHRFTLNDGDVEKIIEEILSGEGLEFQL